MEDSNPSPQTADDEAGAIAKKQEVLKRALADQAVRGQPTGDADTRRDTPAQDAIAPPQGQTNQTR